MHALLAPDHPARSEALERCDAYLSSRWKRWSLARRLLPPDQRDDVTALGAWHEVVREETRGPRQREALDELTRALERTFANEADSALGMALATTVRSHDLPALLFRGPLEEHRKSEHAHTHETRGVLLRHAKKIAQPEARLLLGVMNQRGEKNEVLADALALGMQLTSWLTHLKPDLSAGRLNMPVEDLARHGVELADLQAGRVDDRSRRLIAEQIAWAREFLAKGWPLCAELGGWKGRRLAFLLRWHAASLSAIEARNYDALTGPPPAGWFRLLACASASLVSPAPPRLS